MVRLILEEDGGKRAFKLNDGTLTIGSSESCALTLKSADVAGEHAELTINGDEVTLKPRAGVMPPTMNGIAVTGEKAVRLGTSFKIGSASFRVEDPEAPAGTAPAAPKRARHGHKAVGTPQSDSHGERTVRRTRPVATIKKGMPSWLIVLILLVFVGGGGFAIVMNFGNSMNAGSDSVEDKLRFAESHFSVKNLKGVQLKLDMIDESELTTASLRARYDALKKNLEKVDAQDAQNLRDQAGTVYFTTQLKNFESGRLKGNPAKKKVRVFLLRCQEFKEKFPNHPEMPWVDRQMGRFGNSVDITRTATFEEIAYEIETLTWAFPQQYGRAFERLAPYLTGEDSEEALKLEAQLSSDRSANFLDRMQQAKYEWTNVEKGDKGRAASILRSLIVNYGDPSMVEQAATELIGLPGVKPLMEAWKRDRPVLFEELMENETARGYAKRNKLL